MSTKSEHYDNPYYEENFKVEDNIFLTNLKQQTISDFCANEGISLFVGDFVILPTEVNFSMKFLSPYVLNEELDEQQNLKMNFLIRIISSYWRFNLNTEEKKALLQCLSEVHINSHRHVLLLFNDKKIAEHLQSRCTAYPLLPMLLHSIHDFPQFNGYLLWLLTPPFTLGTVTVEDVLTHYDAWDYVDKKLFDFKSLTCSSTIDFFDFLEMLSKRFFLRFQTESLLADLIVFNMPKNIENFIAIYNSCATILDEPLLNLENVITIECTTDTQKQNFYNNFVQHFYNPEYKIILYHDNVIYLHTENQLATLINLA